MSRILVVDDEPIIRMLLADSLADAGHTVTAARNGAEALDRALRHRSDIVLLDLLMPGMDGFTFLRERQAHPNLANVPVIVLSAAGAGGLREASELRASAVLSKPVDLDVLSTVIDHVLHEWATSPRPELEPGGRPIGTCPICGQTVHAEFHGEHDLRSVHEARLKHVLSHTSTDIAGVPLRRRLLDIPSRGRQRLATWLYHELRRDWGDQDRRGVHSIASALGSATMHRLWHEVEQCSYRNCQH